MNFFTILHHYAYSLIHPFKTHKLYMSGESDDNGYKPEILGIYESLGVSWIFVVISGIVKIVLINLVLFSLMQMLSGDNGPIKLISYDDGFIGFYFIMFQTILDVIFYPLIMLFIIQFWEFVIKLFGSALGDEEDIELKAKNIMSVALSSSLLTIVPVFGGMAQKFASLILMYAGLREQLKASAALSICIMLVPMFLFLALTSIIVLLFILNMA